MEVKRGKPPETVDRTITVEMTREEILSVIVSYIKKKINSDCIRLDNIKVIGSPDGKLESISLDGVETITLTWQIPDGLISQQ